MKNYLKNLARVVLELAAFACVVALLLIFLQFAGERVGVSVLLIALVLIVLLLAAFNKR